MSLQSVPTSERLDRADNSQWEHLTPQEKFTWVAVIVSHKKQMLYQEDPVIGFYGAVHTKKQFTVLAKHLKEWFKKTHDIDDIPVYMMQLSWQRPHLLTVSRENMTNAKYVQRKIDAMIEQSYRGSIKSALDMTLRQQADTDESPELSDMLTRKAMRKLVKPKQPAWKRDYIERVVAAKKAARASTDSNKVLGNGDDEEEEEEEEEGEGASAKAKTTTNVGTAGASGPCPVPMPTLKSTASVVYEENGGNPNSILKNESVLAYKIPMNVLQEWGMHNQHRIAISSLISNDPDPEVLFYLNAVYNDDVEKMNAHITGVLTPRIDGHIVFRGLPMFAMLNMCTVHTLAGAEDVYTDAPELAQVLNMRKKNIVPGAVPNS